MTEIPGPLRVVIRADASVQMGSGHVMRCLTLADMLRERGADVRFICRDLPGHLGEMLADKGYPVYWLPAPAADGAAIPAHTAHSAWLGVPWAVDADQTRDRLAGLPEIDWMIVDHYALDRTWESRMRPLVKRIMVIDDLADRPHDCDLLLDQNLYEGMEQRYAGLLPVDCRQLLGPRYALLRPEFREARQHLRKRDGVVRRILVFFGGADPTNETAKALRAIQMLDRPEIAVDVVVGAANPHRAEIEALCAKLPNASFHCQVTNMAELMARADLAIGATGVSTWERAVVGLPALVVTLAENQRAILLFLISCSEIINSEIRDRYIKTLVIHASDLPEGRGWSPHIWQILKGKNDIVVTLLEAEDQVDSGAIWDQRHLNLEGHELYSAPLRVMEFLKFSILFK